MEQDSSIFLFGSLFLVKPKCLIKGKSWIHNFKYNVSMVGSLTNVHTDKVETIAAGRLTEIKYILTRGLNHQIFRKY